MLSPLRALSQIVEHMTLATDFFLESICCGLLDGSRMQMVSRHLMTELSFSGLSAHRRARAPDVKRRAKDSGLLYVVSIQVGR